MSDDSTDDQIRATFRKLRDRHQPPLPPTDAIVGEVHRRRQRRRRTVVAVAAATILAFVLPIALVTSLSGGSSQVAGDDNPAICQEVFFTSGEGDRYEGAYAVFGFDEHGVRGDPLTDDHASQEAVVSPDGKRMVVVSGRGHQHNPDFGFDVTSLYVSDLDGSDERRLTTGHVDELPAWSPDGSQVAFVRRSDDGGDQILVIDVANPTEPTVVQTSSAQRPRPSYLAWLDDDTVAWWGEATRGRSPLVSRAASGTGPVSTLVPDVTNPVLSADRTRVAYTTGVEGSDDLQQIAVREVGGQVSVVAESASMYTTPVAWTSDDRLFFTRNVEGPGVNLVVVEAGDLGSTEVVGQPEWEGYEAVHQNPVCG
jgi:dipeptidyl aminopeptidase/acylaminoacyl peptidase